MTAYSITRWVIHKVVGDIGRVQYAVAGIGAAILTQMDSKQLEHEVASSEQQPELQELRLLGLSLAIKEQALATGGFEESHGPALAMCANALQDACDWDEESVMEWFGSLVLDEDGENLGAEIEPDDEGDE